MQSLLPDSGKFRKGNEGVYDEKGNCIFVAPKPDLVPELMKQLFLWMQRNKDTIHPLILSSVFGLYLFILLVTGMVKLSDPGKTLFYHTGKIFLNIYLLNHEFINIKKNTNSLFISAISVARLLCL